MLYENYSLEQLSKHFSMKSKSDYNHHIELFLKYNYPILYEVSRKWWEDFNSHNLRPLRNINRGENYDSSNR